MDPNKTSGKSPVMFVAVVNRAAFIKLPGRANFASSIDFKTIVTELRAQGINRFILDLNNCVTMDSTFLGVLAGLALRHADAPNRDNLRLDLLNPNQRIEDLLDNLGVIDLFTILHQETPCTVLFEPVPHEGPIPSKEEISRNCLEAHQLLMDLNPENIPKFKEVTQFLSEDLRKMKEEQKQDSSEP